MSDLSKREKIALEILCAPDIMLRANIIGDLSLKPNRKRIVKIAFNLADEFLSFSEQSPKPPA